jgi:hypothetical protein
MEHLGLPHSAPPSILPETQRGVCVHSDAAEGTKGLSAEALSFFGTVADAAQGLPEAWIWQRGGFSGPCGDAYRECLYAGLLSKPLDRLYLTDAGAERLGLPGYTANDPSTWDEQEAERFFLKGYCHALASALNRRFGCAMVLASSVSRLPLHVFVQDADGVPFDFDGATSKERILGDLGVARAVFTNLPDEASVRGLCGGHNRLREFTEDEIAMALKYIDGRPDKYADRIAACAGPVPKI